MLQDSLPKILQRNTASLSPHAQQASAVHSIVPLVLAQSVLQHTCSIPATYLVPVKTVKPGMSWHVLVCDSRNAHISHYDLSSDPPSVFSTAAGVTRRAQYYEDSIM